MINVMIRNVKGNYTEYSYVGTDGTIDKAIAYALELYIKNVLNNFNSLVPHDNAIKYYINGGIIDERRFIEKNFNKEDEFVRVYSKDEFLGIGKLIRKDNITSIKSDKLFIV